VRFDILDLNSLVRVAVAVVSTRVGSKSVVVVDKLLILLSGSGKVERQKARREMEE